MAGHRTPVLSLKARAFALLARREYSREELARKLAAYVRQSARQDARAGAADEGDGDIGPADVNGDDAQAGIAALLDELERDNWLSNQRFAQSFSRRRGQQRGTALVMQELRQHKLDEDAVQTVREHLQETELQRARQAWEKKFGQPPADGKSWARQARFMLSRGFSASTFKQVLAALGADGGDCADASDPVDAGI